MIRSFRALIFLSFALAAAGSAVGALEAHADESADICEIRALELVRQYESARILSIKVLPEQCAVKLLIWAKDAPPRRKAFLLEK